MPSPPPPAAQVFLVFPEDYPAADLAAVLADFAVPAGLVQVQHTEWTPPTAAAWAAPTAVAAHLGASFMATLRPGAATPETPALLVGLQRLAKRCCATRPTPFVGAAGGNYRQSVDFSIVAQGTGGQRLKLLFDTALGPAAWAAAVADVLPIVATHYLQRPAPAARPAALAGTSAPMLYLVHHPAHGCWELQNDASMQVLHRRS